MGTQLTATETGSPTSGIPPTRSQAPRASCARTVRRPITAAAIFAYNHSRLIRLEGARPGRGVPWRVRAWRDAEERCGRSPGRSPTSGASTATARDRPPIAAAPWPTCRAASPAGSNLRLLDVRALGDGAGRDRHRLDDRPAVAGERPPPRHRDRGGDVRSSSRGVGADPPPGGYRPADLIFFGHGDGRCGPRRALARQRSDRPVLVERGRRRTSDRSRATSRRRAGSAGDSAERLQLDASAELELGEAAQIAQLLLILLAAERRKHPREVVDGGDGRPDALAERLRVATRRRSS